MTDERSDFDAADLRAYVARRSSELGLHVPHAYLPGVIENLNLLRTHAGVMTARLPIDAQPSSRPATEPPV